MFKKLCLLALILSSNNVEAITATTSSKISDGIAIERIKAYAASSTKAKVLGYVEPGTEVIEFRTFMKTNPGLALMEDNSWDTSIQFDRGAHIYIWEYLGDGYSKVIINGVRYNTKIARSKSECDRFAASPKYCWAKVLEEPEYYEWKHIALKPDGTKFWILNRIVDGSGIIAIKDQGIEKSRVVHTKYVDEPKKVVPAPVVEKKNNALLADPALKTKTSEKAGLAGNVATKLMMSPEERAIIRQEAKAKLKAMNNPRRQTQQPVEEISQEDMFKQQRIKNLEINFDNTSTQNTLETINKETQKPAAKLTLEANKPLELPAE